MYEKNDENISEYNIIRIGLPKGNVFKRSINLIEKFTGASLFAGRLKIEYRNFIFYFLKHRDIPLLVENRKLDYGITSDEWIVETGVCINRLIELDWCNTKVAIIKSEDYKGKLSTCVSEYKNIANKYFDGLVRVDYISGSSEALVPSVYDCCVDCIESGNTLKANNLVVENIILNSKIVLISKKQDVNQIKDFVECI